MSIPGHPVVILPGNRPPPPVPPDVAEIVRVLNGEPPKVCPACGRPWRPDAPCVCLEPEPVASWWVRLWRRLRAVWAAPEPVVVYDAELPRPTPPKRPFSPADGIDFTGPTRILESIKPRRDYAELARLAVDARPPVTGRLQPAIATDQSVPGRIVVTVKDP